MKIRRVGVDLAKNVFQLHGADHQGKTVWKRQLSRDKWLKVLFNHVQPGAEIGMEACTGAHHWARLLRDAGYRVRMIPPQFVKPFVKSNKNDANDAQAICEAMARPDMYPVAIKTVEQQDIQAIHRVREEIKTHRTAKANQIRGLVAEYGLVAPRELTSLRRAIPIWLEDASNGLTVLFRELLHGLREDLRSLDQRMAELDQQVATIAQQNPTAQRLQQLRGVGPLIATALIATVGDGKQYRKGRDMAAAIGLTPRQHSSGGKDRLLGISKRGDAYLRCLLVHGARSAMRTAKDKDDRLSRWITSLQERRHANVAAVAMANKLARMAWVIMSKEIDYDPDFISAT
ncbi:IS110 family transposase [Solemya velum gill symbiont]|uniref:IS110 family transposase n=1 Tax=Solemya velum gill symbiont TaxID=2340 RepID=UPI000997667D|nr:IS110 family transposase [Solemya velum gill symbiont]OOZ53177.1 IS110 family transposase [Solemya velum gill symbiont]